MKITKVWLVGSLLVVGTAGQCSLCSDSNSSEWLTRPDTIIPTTQQTCRELDTFLADLIPTTNTTDTQADCNALRDEENTNIYLSGYCGCPEEPPATTGSCNFCTLENVYDADRKIDDSSVWTCGNLAELTPFVTNPMLCDEFQKSVPQCCSDFQSTCTLCGGDGSTTMETPEKVLWNDEEMTCELANQYLAVNHNNDDACNAQRVADSKGVDLVSYCGCSGAEPPNTCQFCSDLWNADFVVYNDTTCGDLAEMAPFLTNNELCSEDFLAFAPLCCSDFEATCNICEDNSEMTRPDRVIPGTDQTCELADRYFGMVQPENNTGACQALRSESNSNIHQASFCGCQGEAPPATCSFCSVDNLIDPDFVVDEEDEAMTCGYLADVAPYVTNDELCADFQYFIPLCCADFEPTCTICSSVANDGAILTKPATLIPGMLETTCGIMDRYFGLIQEDATACNAKRVEASPDIDIAAFCGCAAEDPPDICKFCSEEDLLDPDKIIGNGDDARSCGYLASVAPYVANETLCAWLEYAEPQCCDMSVKEPCSVCNGAQMGQPNRIVEYKEGTTCQELDNRLRRLPEDICGQVTGDWEIDLDSYCGCEGSMVIDRCQLCGEGHELKNHLSELPDKPLWNCKVGHENAKFITSDQVCTSEIRTSANIELCCEPIPPTISPMPSSSWTGPPTTHPTTERSGSWALSLVVSIMLILVGTTSLVG